MNSPKTTFSKRSEKAVKNTVGVQTVKGMVRLSLPRSISRAAYGIDQKFIFPGLEATPLNLRLMQSKADQMSVDIATGNFDPTWQKYQLGVAAANKLVSMDGGKKTEIDLLELWEKFKEYKRSSLAETTFIRDWQKNYTKILSEAIQKTDGNAMSIRNYIIQNRNKVTAKNLLSALDYAYQWAIQHELASKNPFLGMSKEIDISKKDVSKDKGFDEYEDLRAFSLEETKIIIEAFRTSTTVSHWADFVEFLFYTGCRPGEAAALRWKHVSPDCSMIRFSQSYDATLRITKSTKTETIRLFPCSESIQSFLLKIKPENANIEDLVFRSKNGHQINAEYLGRVWRGKPNSRYVGLVSALAEQGKIRQYLKPYATRHTFISTQVDSGVPAHVIAAWCGNSADVIWKHYYQHKHDLVPVDVWR